MTDTAEKEPQIEHEPDCAGFDPDKGYNSDFGICVSICHFHMQCEPARAGDFIICGECMHVFRTPKELVDAHMKLLKEIDSPNAWLRPAASDISCCPFCVHDF